MKPRPEFTLRGRGSESSSPRTLARGTYRLSCTFPPDSLARVRVLDTSNGSEILEIVQSGSGEAALDVPTDGRYVVAVDPADEATRWEIAIRPLGLPSRGATGA